MKRGSIALAVAALVAIAMLVDPAFARPGGGDSYSGGGGHGGGGGGYSGGGSSNGGDIGALVELLYWIIRLTLEFPHIMVPILGIVAGFILYEKWKQTRNRDWDSGPPVQLQRSVTLGAVRNNDANFSQVAFEDFVFRLYAAAHRSRHEATLLANAVGPYVSADARRDLTQRAPVGAQVHGVVIGAIRTVRAEVPMTTWDKDGTVQRTRVTLEFEANLATTSATQFVVEVWTLVRNADVVSKPPSQARTFPCPNCGAPWATSNMGTQVCASCNQTVDNGRFDWVVESVSLRSIQDRPPTLTEEVPERGTELPTYRAPGVDAVWVALQRADSGLTDDGFQQRLNLIYGELNTAWTKNDLAPARGLLTDGLYDYLQYWLDAYRAQGLRNVLENMRITHSTIAKVARDKFYDAVTVRIWATGKDHVIREPGGDHVRGSKLRERPYSEYWTLIRAAGRKGAPTTDRRCSNCGAPLAITQSGECPYCNAHVTSGEFDWVLSKIEQDDSYRG